MGDDCEMKRSRVLAGVLALVLSCLLLMPSITPVFARHPETDTLCGLTSLPPAAPAVNVTLRDGDARSFAAPPDVIAYANTQHSTPPSEFTIVISGNIWRYNQWIALLDKGNFARATTTVDVTSLGVQFWGDTNDGWARVSVDGSEVWRGNTYGTDAKYPGGAFVKYLEISGLASGKHTVSVENMGINGGGGDDVTIFFFGLRKATTAAPPSPVPPTSPPSTGGAEAAVDVWTNKGGEGQGMAGGTFQVGEETIIYVRATNTLQAIWTISGPSTAKSGSKLLEGGETYQLQLGQAEKGDVGQWQVAFESEVAGQGVYDMVSFTVVSSAPASTSTPPVSPPETMPPVTGQSTESIEIKIDSTSATELAALVALKMAEGELDADLCLDADGDGEVTREDARLILQWAVAGFDADSIQAIDSNKDGEPDKYVYNFPREQVAPDLFLDKSIELEKDSSGYSKGLILKFENTGDEPIEYRHVEFFPKSFAESIDDIEFSRTPDRVIDPDPVVEWLLSLPGDTIDFVTSYVPGFDYYPMDPDTFAAMEPKEKCEWIKEQIGPHMDTITKAANEHNIPPWLLAAVILNELADYNFKDQFQEWIFNRGSVGMAQINVKVAVRHGLVDVSAAEVDRYLRSDVATANNPLWEEWYYGTIDYITWEKLNQPEYAIEAAAREIDLILQRANENLDKTWTKSLLNGPIDRDNLYANVRIQIPNERDPEERRILQKEGLALLVIAPYNTEPVISDDFDLKSPYHKRNRGESYRNGINHANNGVDLFVRLLEDCGLFKDSDEQSQIKEEVEEPAAEIEAVGQFTALKSAWDVNIITFTFDPNKSGKVKGKGRLEDETFRVDFEFTGKYLAHLKTIDGGGGSYMGEPLGVVYKWYRDQGGKLVEMKEERDEWGATLKDDGTISGTTHMDFPGHFSLKIQGR